MMILDRLKSEFKLDSKLPFPRCEHRSPTGRQCTQPVCSTSPDFCFTHKPKPDQLLIAELTEAAGTLSTSEEIHSFLKKVTLLRIQGRITPKEAGNYTYLCQMLQRNLRDIAFHQKLREERAEREAEQARSKDSFRGWHLPRPDRSGPSDPPPDTTGTSAVHSEPSEPSISLTPLNAAVAPSAAIPNPSTKPSESSTPSTSSTSLPSALPTEPPPPPKPLPRDFYNHFHPIDPSLPPGAQDLSKSIPPPDEAECARRNARRGFPNSRFQRKPSSTFFQLWRR